MTEQLELHAAPPRWNHIFDSHAHYDDSQFDGDREQLLGWVLQERGVVGIVNMGSDLESCQRTVELSRRYDYVYGGVGIHPECARDLPEDWLIQEMCIRDRVTAPPPVCSSACSSPTPGCGRISRSCSSSLSR